MANLNIKLPPRQGDYPMYDTPEQASEILQVWEARQISDAMNCAFTRADSIIALLENGVDSGDNTAKITKGGLWALNGQLEQIKMLFSALEKGEVR